MIAVAMSGGVDSSAAAVLLTEQGQSIVGLSMQLWNQRRAPGRALAEETGDVEVEAKRSGRCCSLDDVWDARRVAHHVGFPFYVLNLEDPFERAVVRPFVESYLSGETPSPCVLCNNFVKFSHLVDKAEQIGADRVATGHYAGVRFDPERKRWLLIRGRDRRKDQSYFLFGLTQSQLSRTVFPLGELTKDEVRTIARRAGLPTHDKPESQEICFVQEGSYARFVEQYAGPKAASSGEIVNLEGEVVGSHAGVHRYTVGQRKGLVATGVPQYVVRIDPKRNRVVIGGDQDTSEQLFRVRDANWIAIGRPPEEPMRCDIQIRNRFEPRPGTVWADGGETFVRFDEPQRAVTPGQAAVFYWDDVVVGGGWVRPETGV
jgi:tRNA-specific 2-thiouridylase